MRNPMLIVGMLLVFAVPATGQETYHAIIGPSPSSSGAFGSGVATLTLDRFGTTIEYNIQFEGLTGPELAAHIHRPGGAVAHALPLGSPKIGVWQNVGSLDVFSLQAEQLFILIHTNQNPGGELRGNIVSGPPPPLPVEAATWGGIKAVFDAR